MGRRRCEGHFFGSTADVAVAGVAERTSAWWCRRRFAHPPRGRSTQANLRRPSVPLSSCPINPSTMEAESGESRATARTTLLSAMPRASYSPVMHSPVVLVLSALLPAMPALASRSERPMASQLDLSVLAGSPLGGSTRSTAESPV